MGKLQPISTVIDVNRAREALKDIHGLYINGEYFGLLTEPFAPDFSIEWDDDGYADIVTGAVTLGTEALGAVSPNMGKVVDVVKKADPSMLAKLGGIHAGQGVGLMAKKMFSKAGHWTWTANCRIVDYDGEGLVMKAVERIARMALPSISSAIGTVGDALSAGAGAIQKLMGTNPQEGGIIDQEAIAGAMTRSVVFAPQPVHIRVGRYANTMGGSASTSMKVVIESFTPTLSPEIIEGVGPMWCDFGITFASVEPMVAEAFPVGSSRVTIIEGG